MNCNSGGNIGVSSATDGVSIEESRVLSLEKIKAEAKRLGFCCCGVSPAEDVDSQTQQVYRRFIAEGRHAGMLYLADNVEKRFSPKLLMPEVRSIISVAMSYKPKKMLPRREPQIAAYALGKDYHEVMKQRLWALAEALDLLPKRKTDQLSSAGRSTAADLSTVQQPKVNQSGVFRAFVDTAPVLERYWAVRSGLGFVGKNKSLIIPEGGNMYFLGEIFTDLSCRYDEPTGGQECLNCNKCVKACPTAALSLRADGTTDFNANKCLSYHTIENRGEIPQEVQEKMRNKIFGCDDCLTACPYNALQRAATEPLFDINPRLLEMRRTDWQSLSEETYRSLFKNSAVKRAKYSGLMRNIKIATSKG